MLADQQLLDTGTKRLLELGIRQQLHRPLHWTQNTMICFCILSSITCITGLYRQGLEYGGPVVLVWGWVCAGALHIVVGFAMSELSSAFPVSGGLYYWAFMLADKHGPFASWIVGWINLLGQVSLMAGSVYTCVEIFAGVLFLATRDKYGKGYYPSNGMQLYLYLGLLVANAIVNSAPLKYLAKVAKIGVMWHFIGVFTMAAVMLTVVQKQQTWVWVLTEFKSNPSSNIKSSPYIALIGLAAASWPLMGYDSVAHLIEETKSADAVAGRPMPWAIAASAVSGLVYIMTLTVCIQDYKAITNPPENLAQVNTVALIVWDVFEARYGWGKGGAIVLLVPLGCAVFCGLHCGTSAARMLYGFSRDRAVPFWWLWTRIDDHGVPIHAVWGITLATFLMGLPLIQGASVFNTCSSIATAGLCIDYAMPIGCRLFLAGDSFEPGPFTMGRWSFPVSIISIIWLVFAAVIFTLPTRYPVTRGNFNYAAAVVGGVCLVVTLAWVLSARFWFTGPRTDVDNSDAVKTKYWVTDPPRRVRS